MQFLQINIIFEHESLIIRTRLINSKTKKKVSLKQEHEK